MTNRSWVALLSGAGIAVLALALYFPVLQNEFVENDVAVYALNQDLRDPHFMRDLFSRDYRESLSVPDYYSPMAAVTYRFDLVFYSGSGARSAEPGGAHATTWVLFAALAVLVFDTLRALTGRIGLAALAAAIFVVHPMDSEAANFASTRPELLGALFTLAATRVSWIETDWKWGKVFKAAGIAFLTLFAMLSAASGLAAPLLVVAADWVRRRWGQPAGAPAWNERLTRVYPWLAAAVAMFIGLRLAIFGNFIPGGDYHPYFRGLSAGGRVSAFAEVWGRYLSMIVAFWDNSLIYNPLEENGRIFWLRAPWALGAIALSGAVALAAVRRAPFVAAGMLLFTLALLPNLPFWPTFYVVRESKLLLPMVGASLALASLLILLGDSTQGFLEGWRNQTAAAVGALAFSALAAMTWARGKDWKEVPGQGPALWIAEETLHPTDEKVLSSLAFYNTREGRYEEATDYYRRAKDNYKYRPIVFYEMATNYMMTSEREKALAVLKEGLTVVKDADSNFFTDLAAAFQELGDSDSTHAALDKAQTLDSTNWRVYFIRGNVMMDQRQFAKAEEMFTQAIDNAPPRGDSAPLVNRAIAKLNQAKIEGAIEDAKRARNSDPLDAMPYRIIADANMRLLTELDAHRMKPEEFAKAQKAYLRAAIEALQAGDASVEDPDMDLLLELANLQQTWGANAESIQTVRKARAFFPNERKPQMLEALIFLMQNDFSSAGMAFLAMRADTRKFGDQATVPAGLGWCVLQQASPDGLEKVQGQVKQLCLDALKLDPKNRMALMLASRLKSMGVEMGADVPEAMISPSSPADGPNAAAGAASGLESQRLEVQREGFSKTPPGAN